MSGAAAPRRRLAWFAAAALVAAGLAVWIPLRLRNEVRVENRSGRRIAEIGVGVGGEDHPLGALDDGESRTAAFSIRGDDDFLVSGRFEDGSPISAREGYVTNGYLGVRARIVVGPDGRIAEFRQSEF